MIDTDKQLNRHKVYVVGGGFAGWLTAISIKRHCSDVHVTLVESDKEPKNLGFGESGPPQMVMAMCNALAIPDNLRHKWLQDWLISTRSTVKFNFKWENFCGTQDQGYYSGIPAVPSYLGILEPSHAGGFVNPHVNFPSHEDYMIYDLWFELYHQQRRTQQDFQPDINSLYYYCEFHTLPNYDNQWISNMSSVHINSFECCEWLKARFSNIIDRVVVGTVSDIAITDQESISHLLLDSGETLHGDLFIDCTGLKRIFAKKFSLPWKATQTEIYHNSALIVANGYSENIEREMHPYTKGYAMEHGWAFSIPLLNRKSTGYVYHSDSIDHDSALQELDLMVGTDRRLYDPLLLTWDPGTFSRSAGNNWCLMGLSATFVDPFDANVLALQFRQIRLIIDLLQHKSMDFPKQYTNITTIVAESVAERVQLHHGLAPRNTSEYWRRNKDVCRRLNLEDAVFQIMNHPSHSSAAMISDNFVPYLSHLYLSESWYYGLDMRRRCRQSPSDLLDLAEHYFVTTNDLNKKRAKISTSIKDWYFKNGIDIQQYAQVS